MSFDLLAPHYTWMEKILAGPRLQRCRLQWLDQLAGCEHILIAGVGHGHFLRACAQRFPAAIITSLDASAGMLRQAKRRAGAGNERLEFVHASLPDWQPPAASYDAIVTNFFLDCFAPAQLAEVVTVLANSARAQATWLVSDFTVPEHGWRRQRARAIQASMYAFFRPVAKVTARRVTPPDSLLRAAGFTLVQRRTTEWGLLHSDLWQRGK
jgi:ubiquinone/menaquinone biosynthesis C-methylase UbiE